MFSRSRSKISVAVTWPHSVGMLQFPSNTANHSFWKLGRISDPYLLFRTLGMVRSTRWLILVTFKNKGWKPRFLLQHRLLWQDPQIKGNVELKRKKRGQQQVAWPGQLVWPPPMQLRGTHMIVASVWKGFKMTNEQPLPKKDKMSWF